MSTDLLVIGGGPGGYSAAFRAADLGLDVVLVEKGENLGGLYVNNGCLCSKTLLSLAAVINKAQKASEKGILFKPPELDFQRIMDWKNNVRQSYANSLLQRAESKSILRIAGTAHFENSKSVLLEGSEYRRVHFKKAVIATGTEVKDHPKINPRVDNRIITPEDALALPSLPSSLLVIGGNYVGLEISSIYSRLGSKVTLLEQGPNILPEVDQDLVHPLNNRLQSSLSDLHFQAKIENIEPLDTGLEVTFISDTGKKREIFEKVLVTGERSPNLKGLGLANTAVTVDDFGFILCDNQQRTADKNIFTAGDVCGPPLLTHKALREGRIAAENISGIASAYDVQVTPVVIYTSPQISWCGISEQEAKNRGIPVSTQHLSWTDSTRAITLGETDGITKLISDPETGRLIGAGITGQNAELMIAELALAIEMGAQTEDLALTLHPSPSLSETVADTATAFVDSEMDASS